MGRIRSVTSAVVQANFDWTIVRVEDEDGAVGWGESFFAPGLTAILRELGLLLLGRDSRNIALLTNRMQRAVSGAGREGIVQNAISGIDAALWDLNARAAGLPLWRLLGGGFVSRVPLYADCHGGAGLTSLGPLLDLRPAPWSPAQASAAESGLTFFDPGAEDEAFDAPALRARAREMVDRGFRMLKFDLDVGPLAPATHAGGHLGGSVSAALAPLLGVVRELTDSGVDVALDCHWRYDLATARRIAAACEDVPLLWLEDPLSQAGHTGLRGLAQTTGVPLATGENLNRYSGFAELIEQRAVSVVTPDLAKVGGVREARLIADAAHEHGLATALHNIAGPIGTAFSAQVAATFPNLIAVEFHAADVPYFADLVDRPLIVDGEVVLDERPGIGVDVVMDEVRRWAKPGESVFA